jgi:hypothetical protein
MTIDETLERLRAGYTVSAEEQFRIGDALANLRDAVRYAVSDDFPPNADIPDACAARVAWLRGWAKGAKMRGDI